MTTRTVPSPTPPPVGGAAETSPSGMGAGERLLLEQLGEGYALHALVRDATGRVCDARFLDVNGAFERMTGLAREQVVGRTAGELWPGIDPFWTETFARVAETGEPVIFERRHEPLGRDFEVRAFRPAPGRFAILLVDATARKRAELDLALLDRRRLQAVLDALPVGVAITDRRGDVLLRNEAFERLWALQGRPGEPAPGASGFWGWWADSRKAVAEEEWASAQAMERGEPVLGQVLEIERFDGSCAFVLSGAAVLRDGSGAVLGSALTMQDITDLRLAEDALREANRKYTDLVDSIPDGFHAVDRAWRFTYVNRRTAAEVGIAADALVGRVLWDTFPRIVGTEVERAYRRVMAERIPLTVEVPGTVTDGWYRVGLYPTGEGVASVWTDISERRRMEQALRESEAKLKEADRRKDEFLAMLSHELRNPLAPIRNGLALLGASPPGSDQARRSLAVMERQVGQLTRLVDDLLDVVRISSGRINVQPERMDLGVLVQRTVEDHRAAYVARGVRLEVRAAPGQAWLEADPARLAQVVGNLLHNAAKFTARGGRVAVALEADGASATLRVSDDGVGIAPEMLDRIFEPFVQADTTYDRSRGGLGLGLALVSQLVRLHGGTVGVESPGPGRGTTFTVRLPCAPPPGPAVAPAKLGPRPRRRVLVIEDHVDAAESLREVLELCDHEVDVAYSGPDGLARARAFRPEVVLCDLGLPGLDGFGVARTLRADPDLAGAYLVALSGYALPEDVRRAHEAGFDRHVAKPAPLDALLAVVDESAAATGDR